MEWVLGSLLVNPILAWPIYKFLLKIKSRQTIDPFAPPDHQRKQGTPTMGGLMILPGLLVGFIAFYFDFLRSGHEDSSIAFWLVAIALTIGFGLIGFVDDFVVPRLMKGKRGLGWKQKLVLEIGLSGLIWFDPAIRAQPWLLGLGIFLVLCYSNAYNFADGLDGLAGSLLIAFSAGLGLVAAMLAQQDVSLMAILLLVSVLPFLFFNSPPAKVFMGDVGSLPIGALIGFGITKILTYTSEAISKPQIVLSLIVLSLVLILELALVPIQVGYYKLTKKRIFPATPIHHSFEVMGIPETKIVWGFFVIQSALSILAVLSLVLIGFYNSDFRGGP